MQRKTNYAVVFSAASVFLLAIAAIKFFNAVAPADEPRREMFQRSVLIGERLNASTLVEGEKIVIDRIKQWDVGEPEGVTYVLIGGAEPTLVAIHRDVTWKKDWGPELTNQGESHAYPLTSRQRQGLDVFLNYLIRNDEFWWQYPETYELTYFRKGRQIGSEKRLDSFSRNFSSGKDSYDDAGTTVQHLFSREDWEVVVTFPELVSHLQSQESGLAQLVPVSDRGR